MWNKLSDDLRLFILIVLASLLIGFVCSSCHKDFEDQIPQRELDYKKTFEDYIGTPSRKHAWGDWTLNVPSLTRAVNNDTTTWGSFKELVYPSYNEIFDVISTFYNVYDGINMVNIPKGDYWVKTIHKDTLFFYAPQGWSGAWFHAYEKMPIISIYNHAEKRYEPIENIDSLALIENIDEYDGVMPQFAYFNDLYSRNHFEQRTIEHNGIYYVGFDFYADGFIEEKKDYYFVTLTERDYIYSDFIIMLIPAYRYGQEEVYDEKRVFCEDFSKNPDLDFNDLVYDVAIVNIDGEIKTRITAQAVGTKEKINVGGKEAHSLFGVEGAYINSGGREYGAIKEPVKFYLDEIVTDIRDIPVSVFYENKIYFLSCKTGSIPQRICTSKDVGWSCGTIGIWLSYPQFKGWVADPSATDWEKNVKSELIFDINRF